MLAIENNRGSLPEEASIHTAEMTAMKEIRGRVGMRWVIYRLSELNASYWEQQKKSPNIKPDIWYTSRIPKPGQTDHNM